MREVGLLNAFLIAIALAPVSSLLAADPPSPDRSAETSEQIRIEACRPTNDPIGHPLPLAGHWNTGAYPPEDTFDPAYQLQLIARGHHVMPFLNMPTPASKVADKMNYWEAAFKRMAELHLPVALLASQWEADLTYNKETFALPPEKNPNVISADGKILPELDPFGPIEPWRDIGRKWGNNAGMAKLAAWYPDPPKVLLISNNEHAKLFWTDAEKAKRYLDLYGKGKDPDFKRRVFSDAWVERFTAMIDALHGALPNAAWKANSIFMGYDAFGPPHFARMGDWKEYSGYSPGHLDNSAQIWDGGSPSYYTHNWNGSTDYTVWSPQVEAMNWVFMLEDTLKVKPTFWFELGVWDGATGTKNDKRKFYESHGQIYNADRYGGMIQFGMWLMRPRSVREFRGWTERRSTQGQYFLAVVESVDHVWENPLLTRFWRTGRLVANTAHEHPYQIDVPPEYKSRQRWFLLDTNIDPPRPWTVKTELPVMSLALVLGEVGQREWLVYAHAPLGTREGVQVTIPDYGAVTISAPPQGVFYRVSEKTREVKAIAVPLLPAPETRPVSEPQR